MSYSQALPTYVPTYLRFEAANVFTYLPTYQDLDLLTVLFEGDEDRNEGGGEDSQFLALRNCAQFLFTIPYLRLCKCLGVCVCR